MRRIFVFLSMFLLSSFIILRILQEYEPLSFSSFNAVDIVGTNIENTSTNQELFAETLEQLAKETNSVIARRIVEPNEKGETRYVYKVYGKGELPSNLKEASEESARSSDLISSYLIVSGDVTAQKLVEAFDTLGYSSVAVPSYSLLTLLLAISVNDISVLSVVLFLLTFTSLTIIYRIKDLRSAGIRRIAGQSFLTIMLDSFLADCKLLFCSYLVNVVLAVLVLCSLGIGRYLAVVLYLLGISLYTFVLAGLSLTLSLVYVIGLKSAALVEILKGKLPLKRLLFMMLIGQLLSVLAVGWSTSALFFQYHEWHLLEGARKEWDQTADYFQLSYSYSAAFSRGKEQEKQQSQWYAFADEMLGDGQSLFVKSNVKQYNRTDAMDGSQLSDYLPEGNTLYVSPSYLEKQNIEVDKEFINQMASLQEGEFGLILPEKLKNRQYELQRLYEEYMAGFSSVDLDPRSRHLFQVKAHIFFVTNEKERFIYNTDSAVQIQYLKDPIIVVTTPKAMGNTPSSRLFWSSETAAGLHAKAYQSTIDSLKAQGVYHWTSYLLNDRTTYYQHLDDSRSRFMFLLAGTLLGLLTSVLFFDTMNLIYFEQFRREILIKRLAGMPFKEIHVYYLAAQSAILCFSFLLLLGVTRNFTTNLLTVVLFSVNMFVILYRQSNRENQAAVTILKGK